VPIRTEQERKSLAASLKQKGNDAYQARKFAIAAQYYTRAIAVSPQPEPVFYSNRAACYVSMEPPQHENAAADCDEALKLDSRYVKALNRRATALEALERYEESLRGACCGHKTKKRTTKETSSFRFIVTIFSQTTLLLRFWATSRTKPRAVLWSACWKSYRRKRLRRSSL
jgi:tetratricopeptide (TPR) repeat protein